MILLIFGSDSQKNVTIDLSYGGLFIFRIDANNLANDN